jgi:exonuclease III
LQPSIPQHPSTSATLSESNHLNRKCPSGLNIATLNVRSINNKSACVTDFISSRNIDVLALQETWHENSESLTLLRAVPAGYSIVEAARSAKSNDAMNAHSGSMRESVGGGVAIIYRAELKMKKINTLPIMRTCEYVCCRFGSANCGDIIVLSLYRPGSKPLTSDFFIGVHNST